MTQEEIGKELGISQQNVASKISKIEEKYKEIQQNPELEIEVKYQFLSEKLTILQEFKPLLYNIWNQQSYDSDNTHFGKFPFTFMENLIYYYTEPFDVVYDPFTGGGTTIDVCNKWLRKYYASDLNPQVKGVILPP